MSFTIQDEDEAAELASSLLISMANRKQLDTIYSNSHTEFQKVSKNEFLTVVDTFEKLLKNSSTKITGYETWDGEDSIAIYGSIEGEYITYFKIGFWGDSTKGYKLYGIHAGPENYDHTGSFGVFDPKIEVKI